jgi:hypothetical protein
MTEKYYVYNETEVVLTGRTAEKPLPALTSRGKNKGVEPRMSVLHEITPRDKESITWKKWVRLTDLFEIKE